MTAGSSWTPLPSRYRSSGTRPEVVAALFADGTASVVAAAAAEEARTRRASLRFVLVVPSETPGKAGPDAGANTPAKTPVNIPDDMLSDTETFSAAMSAVGMPAVAGGVSTPSSVEIARGDPVPVLLDRSRRAAVLVLARRDPDNDVVRVCFRFADCPVRLVDSDEDQARTASG